jgi:hypothetical protein
MMRQKGCLAVLGLLFVLVAAIVTSNAIGQIRDDFNRADTTALTGQRKWVALGAAAPMRITSNSATASLTTSGMNYSLWDSQMTSLTEFRLRVANPGTWLSGRAPILLTLTPTKTPAQLSGGFTFRGNLSGTAHQIRMYYRAMITSVGSVGYAAFSLPTGATTFQTGDTLVIRMLSFYPFQASVHRWRVSGTRDSLGVATDTNTVLVNQLTSGFYASLGANDSTNTRWDDFYTATIGAQLNSPPSITVTVPAQGDTGTPVGITVTASDGPPGAGLNYVRLYYDGVLDTEAVGLTGTSLAFTKYYTWHTAGSHTFRAETADDSGATANDPATGSKSITINAPSTGGGGGGGGGITYGSRQIWYYLYGGQLNMSGLGGTNGGMINVATFDWNLADVYIAFGGSVSADGTLNLGSMLGASGRTTLLNDYLHARGKQILFLAGGSTNTEFATAQNDLVATQNLCHNIKLFMQNYHYDGFDIDLESGLNVANMQRFVRILKDTMNTFTRYNDPTKRCLITAFIYSDGLFNAFQGGGMDTCIDYYNLGSYDQAGTWQNLVWHTSCPTTYDSAGNIPSYNLRPVINDLLPSVHKFIKKAKTLGWPTYKLNAFYDFNGALYRSSSGNAADPTNGVWSIRQRWSTAPSVQGDENFYQMYPRYIQRAEQLGTVKHDSLAGYAAYIEMYHPEIIQTDTTPYNVPDSVLVFADSISIRRFVQVALAESVNFGAWDMGEGSLPSTYTRPHRMYEYVKNALISFTDTTQRQINSTTPSTATAGGAGFNLDVYGLNFHAGDSVIFNGTYKVTTFINSGNLRAAILASDIATAGTKTVNVQNAGISSNTVSFTVTASIAKPELSSGSPNKVGQGAGNFSVVWAGSGFQAGAAITFSGTGITVNATTFNSTTQLTTSLTVSGAAATGNRTVYVTNADGQRDTLVGGLAITDAPAITIFVPDSVRRGQTVSVQVQGNHFKSGSLVSLAFSPSGISFVAGVFTADSTRWAASIVVDGAAATGYRNVTMTNGDGGVATISNAIRVYVPADTTGGQSQPLAFLVKRNGVVGTMTAADYVDWNIRTSAQTGTPAAGKWRQFSGGFITDAGQVVSSIFTLGLASDGTLSSSQAYLADGEAFSWTLSGGTFTGSVRRATNTTFGSVRGGGAFDISDGIISLGPNSVTSENIAGELNKSVLPFDAMYATGTAGTFAVNNGDGTVTFVDTTGMKAPAGGSVTVYERQGYIARFIKGINSNTNDATQFTGIDDPFGITGNRMGGANPAIYFGNPPPVYPRDAGRRGRIAIAPQVGPGLISGGWMSTGASGALRAGFLMREPDTLEFVNFIMPTSRDSNKFFVGKFRGPISNAVDTLPAYVPRVGFAWGGRDSMFVNTDSLFAEWCDSTTVSRVGVSLPTLGGEYDLKIVTTASSFLFYVDDVLKLTATWSLPTLGTVCNHGMGVFTLGNITPVNTSYIGAVGISVDDIKYEPKH